MKPILEYGISVWSPHLRKHDREIEQIQRRATRLIKGFDHYNYPERLQELNLPTLYYRRCKCDLIQVFRITKKLIILTQILFDLNLGITRKNHIYKLHKPRCNSTHKIHVFSYIIINDWKGLRNSIGKVNTINAFKSLLEDHWKDADFKFNF